jgi:hypothetical protein
MFSTSAIRFRRQGDFDDDRHSVQTGTLSGSQSLPR